MTRSPERLTLKGKIAAGVVAGLALVSLGACTTKAETTSANISEAADNFEIYRKITFINGITDSTPLIIEGLCSIEADAEDSQLEVTCQTGEDEYWKHFLGLSDNMSYIVEQTEPADVDEFHHRVIVRPEGLVPDFDLQTSGDSQAPAPAPGEN